MDTISTPFKQRHCRGHLEHSHLFYSLRSGGGRVGHEHAIPLPTPCQLPLEGINVVKHARSYIFTLWSYISNLIEWHAPACHSIFNNPSLRSLIHRIPLLKICFTYFSKSTYILARSHIVSLNTIALSWNRSRAAKSSIPSHFVIFYLSRGRRQRPSSPLRWCGIRGLSAFSRCYLI